ncbi:Cytochrome b6-f complex subunit chloroplastic [Chlorella sorokiniana]|uniref:Cytochrome b6-f complex subunit chloroplastic n=1 Tax=Chlorella sorokiniana TaxID=3076 RepID=A0A2P6TQE2_CHLSO|nr:Cytochrome b6-f complex subunit chloroplastic [Chlorella sorokiniana]|eukprot:PRW56249.1 Cytochrome b6-f complex subunit chloroplastic [Chlorella sorokiniana]
MASAVAFTCAAAPLARPAVALKPQQAFGARVAARPALLPARAARRATVQPKALAGLNEVAQLAEAEAGFIFGVSGVMVAITLIGLAFGFVLLRVESLAEEGKI